VGNRAVNQVPIAKYLVGFVSRIDLDANRVLNQQILAMSVTRKVENGRLKVGDQRYQADRSWAVWLGFGGAEVTPL
jgi:hypothetical protein